MPAGRFTRPGCRSVRTRAPIGRGQDLDRLTTRPGCRRASWSRPSTRSPGRCRRDASRGRVADRCGPGRRSAAGRTSTGSPRGRAADVHPGRGPRHVPPSMPAGRFTRPGCRSVRTRATRPRARPRQAHHAAGLPTYILVEALDTLPWSIDTRRLPIGADPGDGRGQDLDRLTTRPVADVHPGRGPRHAPLVDRHAAVADRCGPGRRPRARPRQAHRAAGCRRPSWSRPSTRSPGRCWREASRGWVAEQCGPGRRPRAGPRQAHHAAGCRRASWSRPSTRSPGRSTRGGCRSVQTRATAAGGTSTRSPRGRVADVHPGRGSRHAPLVDAGGKLHAAGLPNGADPSDGRGQDLDRFTTRRGCRRASWSRPSTRSPGRSTRGGCRSVTGPGRRPRAGPRHAPTRPGCRRASWSRLSTRSPGRCRREASRGRVAERCGPGRTAAGQDLDRFTTRPVADVHPGRGPRHAPLVDRHAAVADRCGPGRRPRGRTSTRSPRGRLPTCILVEALDTLPRSMRHAAVADRCGPGRRPRAGPRHAHHAAGLLTCILVEALDTFPQSMPAGSFTRPGCRSVRTRATAAGRTSTGSPRGRAADVHPGRGPRHVPPVDAGGKLHAAGLPIGAEPGATAAGRTSTGSPRGGVADVHPGRGPRHAPPVDAGGKLHAAGLPIGADPSDGRGQDLDTLTTRPGC